MVYTEDNLKVLVETGVPVNEGQDFDSFLLARYRLGNGTEIAFCRRDPAQSEQSLVTMYCALLMASKSPVYCSVSTFRAFFGLPGRLVPDAILAFCNSTCSPAMSRREIKLGAVKEHYAQ